MTLIQIMIYLMILTKIIIAIIILFLEIQILLILMIFLIKVVEEGNRIKWLRTITTKKMKILKYIVYWEIYHQK